MLVEWEVGGCLDAILAEKTETYLYQLTKTNSEKSPSKQKKLEWHC